MFKYLSLLLLLRGSSAMDIVITSVECKESAVTADFDTIDEDNRFSLGQNSTIKGKCKQFKNMISLLSLLF